MKTLSLSEVKMKLGELIEKVHSTDEEIVVIKNGRPLALLISPDDFEGRKETVKIISDPDLMKEIKQGLSEKEGKKKLFGLNELFD